MAEFENYLEQASDLNLSIMGNAELTDISHVQRGHLKLHYHDHDLPPLSKLAGEICAAHDAGRPIAAHCVTRAELMMTLAAIEEAGPMKGDRIEHAAVADEAAIDWMHRLGVIVVTQPNFIAERVDAYKAEVPEVDHQNLWRLKSLVDAGLPWRRAATRRSVIRTLGKRWRQPSIARLDLKARPSRRNRP